MKLVRCLIVLFFCSYVVAQLSPAKNSLSPEPKPATASTDAKPQQAAPTHLPASTAVITVPKTCATTVKTAADCKTVVTRAEFEALVKALSANKPGSVPEGTRGRLAVQYGEMLALAAEAQKRGLDKDSDTEVLLRFARLQVLAQSMVRSIQEQVRTTPDEVQKYYDAHLSDYQGISVQRITVPMSHGPKQETDDPQTVAQEMRKRLVAGEDIAKLQQEVNEKFGLKTAPATAQVLRPSELSPMQEPLTKLKAGEISEPIPDAMAWNIYKSEGPKPLAFDSVKQEIEGMLAQQKGKAAFDALLDDKKPQLNNAFFTRNELRRAQKNPHAE